jgi:hypothetical protein
MIGRHGDAQRPATLNTCAADWRLASAFSMSQATGGLTCEIASSMSCGNIVT